MQSLPSDLSDDLNALGELPPIAANLHVDNVVQFRQGSDPEGGEEGDAVVPPVPPLPPSEAAPPKKGTKRPRGGDVFIPAPAVNPVIAALQKAGLYLAVVEGAEHALVCPWASEHASGESTAAHYFEPAEDAPLGCFHCDGTHQHSRGMGALLEHLNVDRLAARCKSRIRIVQGEVHRVVAAAEKVLSDRGGFYRSNGEISTLRFDPVSRDVSIERVTEQSLTMHLSAACDWQKFDGRTEKWERRDVPPNIVKGVLHSQGTGVLPVLNGLVRQPFLRRSDGVLVTTPGYDNASGTYAAFDASHFKIPALTKENALKALARLKSLLTEFEFAGRSDRAAAVSAMLTASIRGFLVVAPGFNITASSPGSGKSYLASVIAPFAGPGDARNISYPSTQEEATKVVLSLALEQPAAVCFDDMPMDWLPHGAMNRMLTSGSITERKLGSNTVITARASAFVMGTGNNIRPLRDMARRVMSIYLLPQVETVATREYAAKPAEVVRRDRGQYVSDALTIIAAWREAGGPKADVPNIAGFEEWSDLCRHSLLWLGEPDPATSLIEQISHDPDSEQLGNLLYAWHDAFGQRATLVRQVLKNIENDKHGDLADAVMELPCVERGFVNQSRFGRYLARNKNRIVKGLQLIETPHSERRAWAVVPAPSPTAKSAPLPELLQEPPETFEATWLDDMKARGKLPTALSQPA